MKIHHRILFLSLLLCFSFATVAEAEQHLCPSPQSILQAATRNLMKFSNESGYSAWIVKYSSPLDTNEMWEVNYWVSDTPSADTAWNIFQSSFANVRNAPKYASNDLLASHCVYEFSTPKGPIGGDVLLKPDHTQIPICPSPADIKQHLNNKNLMSYNYHEGNFMGGGYSYGTLETSDNFNTNNQWILSFRVASVSSLDDAWNSYLTYMDLLPRASPKAVDWGTFWQCNYDLGSEYPGFSTYKGKDYHVFAVVKG